MKFTKESARREQRLKAVKLAEFAEKLKHEDPIDMDNCINDLQKYAGLDSETARVVAAAYRTKVLPNVARTTGIDETRIAQLMGVPTADFADEKPHIEKPVMGRGKPGFGQEEENPFVSRFKDEEPSMEDDEFEEGELPEDETSIDIDPGHGDEELALPMSEEDPQDDFSEADDNTTVIQIEIPADKLDAVQQAIEQVLGGGDSLGGDSPDEFGDDTPDDFESDSDAEFGGDDEFSDEGDEFNAEPDHADHGGFDSDKAGQFPPKTAKTQVANMNNKELAKRANERAAIVASARGTRRVAEESTKPKDIGLGKDTSSGTYGGESSKAFQHASEAQYIGEDTHGQMTLENSGGNSLQKDNPTYSKQMVPTNNGDNIQLKDSLEIGKKEGSPDGSLEYTVDFAKLNIIPSADPDRNDKFDIPTQIPELLKRKTTVAKIVECQGCDNPRTAEVGTFDCTDCGTRIAICLDCVDDGYCPSCAAQGIRSAESEKETQKGEVTPEGASITKQTNGDGFTRKPHEDDETDRKAMEIFQSRIATAYECAYQLALAGALERSEVESQVDMWMRDGLSPRSMQATAEKWLRVAMTATERIASAAAEKHSVRQASNSSVGVSTNPALYLNGYDRTAPQDLQDALKSIFAKGDDN